MDRWADGKSTCHSTCERYLAEKERAAEESRKKRLDAEYGSWRNQCYRRRK